MKSVIRRLLAVTALSVSFIVSQAQSAGPKGAKKESKAYKVLTAGKEITIKSNRNIVQVLLWTTSGHRVVEQNEMKDPSVTFRIPNNEKIFFLMVGLDNGKIYTEKIGIQ